MLSRRQRPGSLRSSTRRALRVSATAQEGFTLIELLLAVVLVAIMAAAILGIYMTSMNVVATQRARMQNQDDARLAVNQMTRYLRMATSSADNQTSQSNAVLTATAQDLEFFCDLDGDDVSDRVRYFLDSTSLRMQTAAPAWTETPEPHWAYAGYESNGIVIQEAVRNGGTPVFRYFRYGDSGLEEFTPQTASDKQRVVVVAIDLHVNEAPAIAKSNVELSTQVQLRQRYEGGLE